MSKRKLVDVAVVEETKPENPKRDLLEAYLPDGLSPEVSNRILDSLSLLGSFSPEEVLRIQVSSVLLILEQQCKILELLSGILEELRSLEYSKHSPVVGGNGSQPEAPKYVGMDFLYFRELIMRELGVEPDEDTLETLAELAGNPGRLERAIVYTQRIRREHELESPMGFLIAKLRSWRQQDSQKPRRREVR